MRCTSILLMLLLTTPAMAQQGLLGLYVGVGAGNFQFDEDQRGLAASLASVSESLPAGGLRVSGINDSALTWKLFSGWQFTDYIGVEVGYRQARNLETSFSAAVADLSVSARIATDVEIGTARVMGFLPVRWVSLFGGVGYFQADATASENIDLTIAGISVAGHAVTLGGSPSSENGPTVILGAQWALPSVIIRADYEWLDMEAADASMIGIGASLRF